jgi:mannosylglycerate hydrolase
MMGKGDLAIRPGRASGIPVPTPDAQCLGEHTFEYAIFPFTGDFDAANIPQEAVRYEAQAYTIQSIYKLEKVCKKFKPMLGFIDFQTLTTHVQKQMQVPNDSKHSILNISQDTLIISAIKKAEEEQAVILRLYNSSATVIKDAVIHTGFPVDECFQCNFLEENQQPIIKLEKSTWQIPQVRPFSAITLKFSLTRENQ